MSQPTQQQFDEKARRLKVANLRAEVLRLALSPRMGRLALRRMLAAGVEGRREASESGRRKYQERQGK